LVSIGGDIEYFFVRQKWTIDISISDV
jgi:hypothetical protein